MKAGWIVTILMATALSGCATGDGASQNPNLAAPKLVVQPQPDGNTTVFLHGAFREQAYDWLSLSVDNQTVVNRTDAFSLEERVPSSAFYLEVQAQTGDLRYVTRALLQINETSERAKVSFHTDNGWEDPRTFGFPFEHILDRAREST